MCVSGYVDSVEYSTAAAFEKKEKEMNEKRDKEDVAAMKLLAGGSERGRLYPGAA